MARDRDNFSNFDTPYEVQPPKGSAETNINYGGVAEVAGDKVRDPLGVLPPEGKQGQVGPSGSGE
jgi:hypothetical protein